MLMDKDSVRFVGKETCVKLVYCRQMNLLAQSQVHTRLLTPDVRLDVHTRGGIPEQLVVAGLDWYTASEELGFNLAWEKPRRLYAMEIRHAVLKHNRAREESVERAACKHLAHKPDL